MPEPKVLLSGLGMPESPPWHEGRLWFCNWIDRQGGVGSALLQLGRLAGLKLYGTGSGTQARVISALGATPIDYTKGRFAERIRELTGDGVDVALDGIGGRVALGSYRALRRGGRLVMYGHYGTTVGGRKNARKVALFYLSGALVFASNLLPDGKRVRAFQVAKLRDRHPASRRAGRRTGGPFRSLEDAVADQQRLSGAALGVLDVAKTVAIRVFSTADRPAWAA